MDVIVATVVIAAGSCILAGICLTDWGTGQKHTKKSEQVQLPEYYEDLYIYLVECVEVEWQERQGGH